jgi:hypothetical protein
VEFEVSSIAQKGGIFMTVTTIGLDIAKQVFQVEGVDE